jgi:5-(carboxyamino)imidazole ribonucleotide mutase
MKQIDVAVIMGSKSDWDVMKKTSETLNDFHIGHECRVFSAHRTPSELSTYLSEIEKNGAKIIIAAAGLAAHLGGVIASESLLPVIGVPMEAGALKGLDALLSMVQMPPGIPVGVMGIGKPGAVNAALYAIHILALNNPDLVTKLKDFRKKQAEKVLTEKLD